MEKKLPMSLGISRVSSNMEDDFISIIVEDDLSGARFLELKLGMADFARAISGLHGVGATGTVRGLDVIGLKHECRKFEFELSEGTKFRDKETARKIVQEVCPEGWEPDTGFGNQDSFYKKDGKEYAKTTIRRWVELPVVEVE